MNDCKETAYFVVNIYDMIPDTAEGSLRSRLNLEKMRILRDTYYLITPENSQSRILSFGYTVVYPMGRTTGHSHDDLEEVYLYIHGRGLMRIDDEFFEIKEGDVVYIPPGKYHVTYNPGTIPLRFIWAMCKVI